MFKRFTYGFFAALLIVATTGVTISKHFCQDVLADVSFMLNASCDKEAACCVGDNMVDMSCCSSAAEEGCCDDESEQIKVELPFVNHNVQDAQQIFLATKTISFTVINHPVQSSDRKLLIRIIPPISKQNRQVLFQSFLC